DACPEGLDPLFLTGILSVGFPAPKRLMTPLNPLSILDANEALIRLSKVYQLNITMFANGAIPRLKEQALMVPETYRDRLVWNSGLSLNASDCFEVGRKALLDGEFKVAKQWMGEALQRLDLEESSPVKKT